MAKKKLLDNKNTMMYLSMAKGNRNTAAGLAGVSKSTFYRAMRSGQIKAPRNQWGLTPVDVLAARKLVSGGASFVDVASSLGVHRHTVERAVHKQTFKQV